MNLTQRIKKTFKPIGILGLLFCTAFSVSGSVGPDTFAIHYLGHGSLYFEYKNLIIHVDPYSSQADYNSLPDADLIFITHGHSDHYNLDALNMIKKDSTLMVCTQAVKDLGTYTGTASVLNNGDSMVIKGIPVKAVPAYNITGSTIYHPKGTGNGYIFTFGEKRVYVAGDTEYIPEMDSLDNIDIAFLPMNLPYTMTVTMAVDAARKVNPDILYIYHFGNSDTALLRSSLSDQDIKIRIGKSVYYESDIRSTDIPNFVKINTINTVIFYPNPVKDYFILYNTYSGSDVSIYDMAGHVLMQHKLIQTGKQWIDMKPYKSGMYVLNIQHKELGTSRLLILKR